MPELKDRAVSCDKCGRQFNSFMWRVVTVGDAKARSLVDRDGSIVYDLVMVCGVCGTIFHHHTKEKTLVEHSRIYQMAFDLMKKQYDDAIIQDDNSKVTPVNHPETQTV